MGEMKEKINHSESSKHTTKQKIKSPKCIGIFAVLTVSCVCKKKHKVKLKEIKMTFFSKSVMNQRDSSMALLKAR